MNKLQGLFISMLLATAALTSAGSGPTIETKASEDENSRDLVSLESTYTFSSDFRDDNDKLGDGDSLYTEFSYDHRFLIKGNWYFRLGVEYDRFEFGNQGEGLPDHLQAAYAHVALEYVVHDHPAVGLELDPGVYFQNHISEDAIDAPWRVFVTFPLKKDKVFAVVAMGGALYQDPIVAPGGGIIWLISDNVRLQGVFPKPALVYNPSDDWDIRLMGELVYESFRTDDVITPLNKLQVHNAIVQYNEDRVGAQVSYSGCKPFTITAGGGLTLLRQFDFFRHGVRERTDPAPYARVVVEAKF